MNIVIERVKDEVREMTLRLVPYQSNSCTNSKDFKL